MTPMRTVSKEEYMAFTRKLPHEYMEPHFTEFRAVAQWVDPDRLLLAQAMYVSGYGNDLPVMVTYQIRG